MTKFLFSRKYLGQRRSFFWLLILAFLITSLPLEAFAEKNLFQQIKEKIPRKTVEVTDLRTANSKTYLKPDGKTYVTETYLEPIHFRKNGKWQPIDNRIQSKAMDRDHAYTMAMTPVAT